MKIKSITIQGFRGFNEKQTIELHDQLTLLYAPNSYGKTSISEALEWLLYGITSKVEKALSTEEYKGSYRNLHLNESEPSFVNVVFLNKNGEEVTYLGGLGAGDSLIKLVDGKQVDAWPIDHDLSQAPQPFILQHALKYLLLAKPDERFRGFAHLLGLESLESFQRNIQSLCTKPEACLPEEATQLLSSVSAIENRLASQPKLSHIYTEYKKGARGLKQTFVEIDTECKKRVPPNTKPESILPQLLQKREDAIRKIFKGSIVLPDYTEQEKTANTETEKTFVNFIDIEFCKHYAELLAVAASMDIFEQIKFYGLGIAIFEKEPGKCPFCERPVDSNLEEHIRKHHKTLVEGQSSNDKLLKQRDKLKGELTGLKSKLQSYQPAQLSKTSDLVNLEESTEELKKILVPKHQTHFDNVESAISAIKTERETLANNYEVVVKSVDDAIQSINDDKEDLSYLKVVSIGLIRYVSQAIDYAKTVSNNTKSMGEAEKVLQHELDEIAGTEDINILVDLLENRFEIKKSFEIKQMLNGLKGLRSTVDEYVADRIVDAISEELTSDVMEWYENIKTTGDPDVHFSGFDLEKTKTGKVKSRRVKVKAKSYGKELVSAVSTLSESKLNALGLCVNISKNMKEKGPFSFLIIDDPIQSWDADHEAQFIDLIRKLIERGRQVLLMSHNKKWIRMVRAGCRTLNGKYYEFTGYTKGGPHIKEISWATHKERLSEIDAILKNPEATDVQLQYAEEDIRIVCSETTCDIYFKKKGVQKKADKLNAEKVRKLLLESGVETGLVDRISQSFVSTDDAHHAPEDYSPNRERIRRHYSYTHELVNLIK